MNYRDLIDRIEQAGSFHIEHFALIALDLELRSDSLQEIIQDIQTEDFDRMFPDIAEKDWYDGIGDMDKDDRIQILLDYDKCGFIAEIGVHQKSKFRFNDDGSFSSCSVHAGMSYVSYVYGDTIDELIEAIKERCDHYEKNDIKKDKKKQENAD